MNLNKTKKYIGTYWLSDGKIRTLCHVIGVKRAGISRIKVYTDNRDGNVLYKTDGEGYEVNCCMLHIIRTSKQVSREEAMVEVITI